MKAIDLRIAKHGNEWVSDGWSAAAIFIWSFPDIDILAYAYNEAVVAML